MRFHISFVESSLGNFDLVVSKSIFPELIATLAIVRSNNLITCIFFHSKKIV